MMRNSFDSVVNEDAHHHILLQQQQRELQQVPPPQPSPSAARQENRFSLSRQKNRNSLYERRSSSAMEEINVVRTIFVGQDNDSGPVRSDDSGVTGQGTDYQLNDQTMAAEHLARRKGGQDLTPGAPPPRRKPRRLSLKLTKRWSSLIKSTTTTIDSGFARRNQSHSAGGADESKWGGYGQKAARSALSLRHPFRQQPQPYRPEDPPQLQLRKRQAQSPRRDAASASAAPYDPRSFDIIRAEGSHRNAANVPAANKRSAIYESIHAAFDPWDPLLKRSRSTPTIAPRTSSLRQQDTPSPASSKPTHGRQTPKRTSRPATVTTSVAGSSGGLGDRAPFADLTDRQVLLPDFALGPAASAAANDFGKLHDKRLSSPHLAAAESATDDHYSTAYSLPYRTRTSSAGSTSSCSFSSAVRSSRLQHANAFFDAHDGEQGSSREELAPVDSARNGASHARKQSASFAGRERSLFPASHSRSQSRSNSFHDLRDARQLILTAQRLYAADDQRPAKLDRNDSPVASDERFSVGSVTASREAKNARLCREPSAWTAVARAASSAEARSSALASSGDRPKDARSLGYNRTTCATSQPRCPHAPSDVDKSGTERRRVQSTAAEGQSHGNARRADAMPHACSTDGHAGRFASPGAGACACACAGLPSGLGMGSLSMHRPKPLDEPQWSNGAHEHALGLAAQQQQQRDGAVIAALQKSDPNSALNGTASSQSEASLSTTAASKRLGGVRQQQRAADRPQGQAKASTRYEVMQGTFGLSNDIIYQQHESILLATEQPVRETRPYIRSPRLSSGEPAFQPASITSDSRTRHTQSERSSQDRRADAGQSSPVLVRPSSPGHGHPRLHYTPASPGAYADRAALSAFYVSSPSPPAYLSSGALVQSAASCNAALASGASDSAHPGSATSKSIVVCAGASSNRHPHNRTRAHSINLASDSALQRSSSGKPIGKGRPGLRRSSETSNPPDHPLFARHAAASASTNTVSPIYSSSPNLRRTESKRHLTLFKSSERRSDANHSHIHVSFPSLDTPVHGIHPAYSFDDEATMTTNYHSQQQLPQQTPHHHHHHRHPSGEVGLAYTTNEEAFAAPVLNAQYEEQKRLFEEQHGAKHPSRVALHSEPIQAPSSSYDHVSDRIQSRTPTSPRQPYLHPIPQASQFPHQPVEHSLASDEPRNRVFGLSRDLSGPSADSTYLPSHQNARQAMGAMLQSRPDMQTTAPPLNKQPSSAASSSKLSLSGYGDANGYDQSAGVSAPNLSRSASQSQIPSLPQLGALPAPTLTAQPGASSQFSIEVIAPSFDKRGYPIFSGRAARVRGIIRMKAIRDCQVEIKLGAYISQGAPAAVWDGVALMPPEAGSDHKVFSVREVITLEESMMRKRDGTDPHSNSPDDFIFETPFDINLPLGMSTRYVNGEPTITAVSLPPSFEMSSGAMSRERDTLRSASSALRSSAASIRSRSSRLTSFTTGGTQFGATVRDAVERGFGEVYRIGCFYTMDFELRQTTAAPQQRKLFGKSKPAKPTVLDSITVPFIFLGEHSTEQPPPLSIPAVLIANAVARPGSFLGDGWQCERASVKWPGKAFSRHIKRNVDLELHMPDPATVHAPSLFPVLIIIRPADRKLLGAVPAEALPGSPLVDDGQSSGGANSRGGSGGQSHSRHTSVSTQKPSAQSQSQRQQNAGGGANQPASSSSQDQETLDTYDEQEGGAGQDGLLSRFMRSSLTLTRKASQNALSIPGSSHGNDSASGSSITAAAARRAATSSGHSYGTRAPPTTSSSNGTSRHGESEASERRSGGGGTFLGKLGRSRPNTAPPSQSSSETRSRFSGSTVIGSSGQYVGALSGLVHVSLVQTTFCISSGPSEAPKNIRRLISIAELEELDTQTLRSMVSTTAARDGVKSEETDEHETALRRALDEQLDNQGVRVLRALFRVGSDATPSFRCQGIELRYAIKVDLVPFNVREKLHKRPTSGGGASVSSGGDLGGGVPRSHSSISSPMDGSSGFVPPSASYPTGLLHSPRLAAERMSPGAAAASGSGSEAHGIATSESNALSSLRDTSVSKMSGDYSTLRGGGIGHSGETVVSTVYADRAHSYDKVEKGVGALFANVRLVRAAV